MIRDMAILDANILFSGPMRYMFVELALTAGFFQVKWTEDIHREWIKNLLKKRPDLDRNYLEKTRQLMNNKVRDCLVFDYEPIIPTLNLPDPNDRHVLAAAIAGDCNVIVTKNLKDFPAQLLAQYGIRAEHPDSFLCEHLALETALFCQCTKKIRTEYYQNPPYSVSEYLAILKKQGLIQLVSALERLTELI
ncbi:hypothetical protein Pse7367_3926 (plasmid) [Thalassoporum mexicanum PCC 7367]|uniref:PIN domain-containing protein n=1 Tax=Thalassoporum mexicanum TaxID=3457544 RepID=UPI00029F9E22|nr:PIN domain-containing protein [Pseudanabaena sp. PCC 7367]AFY72142.1 hypothetical protein Pse7367_3926 [Pseudanabaena sp. PCC 7367]